MEQKSKKISEAAAGAGKIAAKTLGKVKEKAIQVADRDGDGSIDKKDVTIITDAIGTGAKKAAAAVKGTIEDKARKKEFNSLKPIFAADLDDSEFLMPKLIHVTDMDKKHADSDVCKDSIGYYTEQKEFKLLNIYKDRIEDFGISLYPDADSEFYYVDPCDRDNYIALEEYFTYLKIARINELQRIAQSLGATHFKVTLKEENSTIVSRKAKAAAHVKRVADASAEHESATRTMKTLEISADMVCAGHSAIAPELNYLQRDPSIQGLVSMRMDSLSPLHHQQYMLKLSNTSGIKENDAVKIDTILKSLKCVGNATFVSEVQTEARRYFEYEIDF